MLKISHRGNLNGPSPEKENSPDYVMEAIRFGFDVEVDVWLVAGELFLGHDGPQYRVKRDFLLNSNMWLHCKSVNTFINLYSDAKLHLFYHTEGIALSTYGYIMTAPGLPLGENSVAMMPELMRTWDIWDMTKACGVLTDYPLKYSP